MWEQTNDESEQKLRSKISSMRRHAENRGHLQNTREKESTLYNCQGIVTISAHHACELLALHTKLWSVENSGKLPG